MPNSTLSVIIPNFNHGHLIERQLRALTSQSYPPTEIIIVDDGSTDDSVEKIEQLMSHWPIIKLLKNEQNSGNAVSIQRALAVADGKFLLFAAADDMVLPNFLEASLEILERHPEAAFCSALSHAMDEDGAFLGEIPAPQIAVDPVFIPPTKALELLISKGSWFRCNTAIYDREKFEQLGGFDGALGSYTDGFLAEVLALRYGACFVPSVFCAVRISESSLSTDTVNNLENALPIFSYAEQQMRTTHAEFFPEEYIQRWSRRWRYTVALRAFGESSIANSEIVRLIPNVQLLDRIVLSLFRSLGTLGKKPGAAYLIFRLVPWDAKAFIKSHFQKRRTVKS